MSTQTAKLLHMHVALPEAAVREIESHLQGREGDRQSYKCMPAQLG